MLVLITALELPLQYKVRGQGSVSDPTTADQCRVSALMCVWGGGLDTIGPALSHQCHIHSPFTTSLESGVRSQLKSSVCFFPRASNGNKHGEEAGEEKYTQRYRA